MPGVLKKYLKQIGMVEKKDHPDAEKLAQIIQDADIMLASRSRSDWESIISEAVVAAYNIGKDQGK